MAGRASRCAKESELGLAVLCVDGSERESVEDYEGKYEEESGEDYEAEDETQASLSCNK